MDDQAEFEGLMRHYYSPSIMKAAKEFEGVSCSDESLENTTIPLIVNQITYQIPAIDTVWVSYIPQISYLNPPVKDENLRYKEGEVEKWIERCSVIMSDIKYMLGLPFFRFWSTIVNSPIDSLSPCRTFMYTAVNHVLPNIPYNEQDLKIIDVYRHLKKHVYYFFLKLTVIKHSQDEWFTPEGYGTVVYSNYIVTVPLMLEACALFGYFGDGVMASAISRIFRSQPLYEKDLNATISHLMKTFLPSLEKKIYDIAYCDLVMEGTIDGKEDILREEIELKHVMILFTDCMHMMKSFLYVYDRAAIIFFDAKFIQRLAAFYEKFIPAAHSEINCVKNEKTKTILLKKFQIARLNILRVIHDIFSYSVENWTEDKKKTYKWLGKPYMKSMKELLKVNESTDSFMTRYVITLEECNVNFLFMKDYRALFPVESEINSLPEKCRKYFTKEIIEIFQSSTNYHYIITDRSVIRKNSESANRHPNQDNIVEPIMNEPPMENAPLIFEEPLNHISGLFGTDPYTQCLALFSYVNLINTNMNTAVTRILQREKCRSALPGPPRPPPGFEGVTLVQPAEPSTSSTSHVATQRDDKILNTDNELTKVGTGPHLIRRSVGTQTDIKDHNNDTEPIKKEYYTDWRSKMGL